MAHSSRGEQLDKMLHILTRLSASRVGLTLQDFAGELGVDERTIRRYLVDVGSRYFPIEPVSGDDGRKRWRFVEGKVNIPTLVLRLDEALALTRLESILQAAAPEPWRPPLERLLDRVEQAIPAPFQEDVDRLLEHFGVAPAVGQPKVPPGLAEQFDQAARDRSALHVKYCSIDGRTAERRLDPYLVYISEGATYVHGLDHLHGEPRNLALERVQSVEPMGVRFERPDDFSPASFLEDLHRGFESADPVEVVLRAHGRAARLLKERPESPNQTVDTLSDHEIRLTLHTTDTPALRARILSFTPEVTVESPPSLKQAITEMLQSALAQYAAPPTAAGNTRLPPKRAPRRSKKKNKKKKSG